MAGIPPVNPLIPRILVQTTTRKATTAGIPPVNPLIPRILVQTTSTRKYEYHYMLLMHDQPLRIAYLAARNSIHTVRLVNALAQRGYNISLITLHDGGEVLDERVQLFKLPIPAPWGYFLNVPVLKRLLQRLQPDILHVHYASGYGTLGRLSQFQPLLLSVWGSDIFDFPNQSFLHRALVVKNLRAARQICSTSQVMATATEAMVRSNNSGPPTIAITPFGIDTTWFYPRPELRDNKVFKIGTVKTLAAKYGIDTLIQAFYQLRGSLTKSNPSLAAQLRLGIAGSGPQQTALQALVNRLELSAVTEFTGQLPHAKVPAYLNQLQIYVAASRLDSESFGVAILEASACGLPVVVSRVGGLPEVVAEGVSGYIVAKDNVEQLTEVLLNLVNNQTLRDNLGRAGRELVLTRYNWPDNIQLFENIYKKLSICK